MNRHRLAPSPTGRMHVGNLRTALAAWLAARSAHGRLILRMEDLDTARVRSGSAATILDDLRWLGLDWDEGPDVGGPAGSYVQGERRPVYEGARRALAEAELAYPCACSRAEVAASAPHGGDAGSRYGGRCRDEDPAAVLERARAEGREAAWRFRVGEETIRFVDGVFGTTEERLADSCGDFVIARSDGVFAYQLAVVVDDALMEVTDVVRGSDLLASTARQIALHSALRKVGFAPEGAPPGFLHVPLVLGRSGEKLSKRARPVSVGDLRAGGASAPRLAALLARSLGLEAPAAATPRELVSAWDPARIRRDDVELAID